MSKVITLSTLLFSLYSYAIKIEIIGPCQELAWYEYEITKSYVGKNLGELTIDYLNQQDIPYKGTTRGINQIKSSPIGDAALEILSDTDMRAYGWCYSLDGVVLEDYADEVIITEEHKNVTWYYAYAAMKNGKWIKQCFPSYVTKSPFICE